MGSKNGKCAPPAQTQTQECAKNLNVYHFQRPCPPPPAPCGGFGGFAPPPCGDFGGFGGACGGFPGGFATGPIGGAPLGCGLGGFDPAGGYGLPPGPGPIGYGGGFPGAGPAAFGPY